MRCCFYMNSICFLGIGHRLGVGRLGEEGGDDVTCRTPSMNFSCMIMFFMALLEYFDIQKGCFSPVCSWYWCWQWGKGWLKGIDGWFYSRTIGNHWEKVEPIGENLPWCSTMFLRMSGPNSRILASAPPKPPLECSHFYAALQEPVEPDCDNYTLNHACFTYVSIYTKIYAVPAPARA